MISRQTNAVNTPFTSRTYHPHWDSPKACQQADKEAQFKDTIMFIKRSARFTQRLQRCRVLPDLSKIRNVANA